MLLGRPRTRWIPKCNLALLILPLLVCGHCPAQADTSYFADYAAGLGAADSGILQPLNAAPAAQPVPASTGGFPSDSHYMSTYVFELAGRITNDFAAQFTGSLRLAKRHPKTFALGTAGVLALILTDHHTLDVVAPREALERNNLMGPAKSLSKWGKSRTSIAIVAGASALGILSGSEREHKTGMMLLESVFTSQIWTDAIKIAGGRERPREMEEEVPEWGEGLRSFPSGHASGYWALATVLAHQYPSRKIVPTLAYGTAFAMSYSRMALRAHWLSDVVVGALIGIGTARQVISSHERELSPVEGNAFGVSVDVTGEYRGVSMNYHFR